MAPDHFVRLVLPNGTVDCDQLLRDGEAATAPRTGGPHAIGHKRIGARNLGAIAPALNIAMEHLGKPEAVPHINIVDDTFLLILGVACLSSSRR